MSPDDPRHGSQAGHRAHRTSDESPCDDCRAANALYQRRYRKTRAMYGDRLIPQAGTVRRIQALMRLGWSGAQIADRAGLHRKNIWNLMNRPTGIQRESARKIDKVYNELSMSLPPTTTKGERISVVRTRNLAERNGWPPPLAWNNIDDLNETPAVDRNPTTYRAADLLAEWDFLRRAGVSIHTAAGQLGVKVGAIEKAIERASKVSAA